jgi:hypothetical protein
MTAGKSLTVLCSHAVTWHVLVCSGLSIEVSRAPHATVMVSDPDCIAASNIGMQVAHIPAKAMNCSGANQPDNKPHQSRRIQCQQVETEWRCCSTGDARLHQACSCKATLWHCSTRLRGSSSSSSSRGSSSSSSRSCVLRGALHAYTHFNLVNGLQDQRGPHVLCMDRFQNSSGAVLQQFCIGAELRSCTCNGRAGGESHLSRSTSSQRRPFAIMSSGTPTFLSASFS